VAGSDPVHVPEVTEVIEIYFSLYHIYHNHLFINILRRHLRLWQPEEGRLVTRGHFHGPIHQIRLFL